MLRLAAILFFTIAAAAQTPARSAIDFLAPTPPMGWNSWNKFACNVDETLIRQTADAMVSSGMRDAGYQYVVIDDCWQISRNKAGNIVADPKRFPSGIKALADYVHSKGLKFGLYSDAGTATCQGRPGSLGHEAQDAAQYSNWGVDYVKVDWCNTNGMNARAAYWKMRASLDIANRPIVLSICEWGKSQPWLWAHGVGNLWRTTSDISDRWVGVQKFSDGNCCSNGVLDILDKEADLAPYAGPGHWNDPDMLEIGNGGMTDSEYRAHFSLWAILAAPLMAGNDLRNMSAATREILTNKEVIAVDQDPAGRQGQRIRKTGDLEVWLKPLAMNSAVVILLNRSAKPQLMSLRWSEIGLQHPPATVRDLWEHKDIAPKSAFSTTVPGHAVVMLKVTP
ncbi:MAG TPA: glycoside hydrolase family 27 protein [Candidatus Koribacter sp.]|jgi:alpha-galactosidase